MTCTAQQVRTLMSFANTGTLSIAAQKAGMSLGTASKYFKAGGRICKKEVSRVYPDAFAEVWDEIEKMLNLNPGLQAKTLLIWLIESHPERSFLPSQLRTLQRRIENWRYLKGPSKDVVFAQRHYPGKQSQSDWTDCRDLNVTIKRNAYPHLLFHFKLVYSEWEAANLSQSESFNSLTDGFMRAVRRLGVVAHEHRTDHLTAAVNNHENPHDFTPRWRDFLRYYDVHPSMNNLGEAHENGSVEKSHHLLKDALAQALMLRGSRDFESLAEYEQFVQDLVDRRNKPREEALKEELQVMKKVPLRDWNAPLVHHRKVNKNSLISLADAVYSVENRLIGAKLTALIYPETVRLFFRTKEVAELPRQPHGGKLIDWRHVAVPLSRKPGAFRDWYFYDDCFPSPVWRQVFDALREWSDEKANAEYLSLLNSYAKTSNEQDFEVALELLLECKTVPLLPFVESLAGPLRAPMRPVCQRTIGGVRQERRTLRHQTGPGCRQRRLDQQEESNSNPLSERSPAKSLPMTGNPQLPAAMPTTTNSQEAPATSPATSRRQPQVVSLATSSLEPPAASTVTTPCQPQAVSLATSSLGLPAASTATNHCQPQAVSLATSSLEPPVASTMTTPCQPQAVSLATSSLEPPAASTVTNPCQPQAMLLATSSLELPAASTATNHCQPQAVSLATSSNSHSNLRPRFR